jgi:hypothetical protein
MGAVSTPPSGDFSSSAFDIGTGIFTTSNEVRAAGTSSTQQNYQFVQNGPAPGGNYYRLMEVDEDGQATYSAVREFLLLPRLS